MEMKILFERRRFAVTYFACKYLSASEFFNLPQVDFLVVRPISSQTDTSNTAERHAV